MSLDSQGEPRILLEEPNKNEICKEIPIDSKHTKCFVIYNTEPQAYGGVIEPDCIMLDSQNNRFIYRYFMADYLVEDSISVRKQGESYIFTLRLESTSRNEGVEMWVLEPLKDSMLVHWYKTFNPDETYQSKKDFYIKEEQAKELAIPTY